MNSRRRICPLQRCGHPIPAEDAGEPSLTRPGFPAAPARENASRGLRRAGRGHPQPMAGAVKPAWTARRCRRAAAAGLSIAPAAMRPVPRHVRLSGITGHVAGCAAGLFVTDIVAKVLHLNSFKFPSAVCAQPPVITTGIGVARTGVPGRRLCNPSTMTRSPMDNPESTVTPVPLSSPTLTRRTAALPSSTTKT